MSTPEPREMTVADELARLHETPHMGIPREQLLGFAMAARALSGGLRAVREARGRAGWSDAEHAARLELAADANAIDRLTPAQAREWNQQMANGDVTSRAHRDSGMVISHADLSDGTQIVQASLDDRTVTVAAGSAEMGARVRGWLAQSPSHESLSELKDVAREVAEDKIRVRLDEPVTAEYDRAATDTAADATATATAADATATAAEESATATTAAEVSLADRLGDRVPDTVTGHPSWKRAEKVYGEFVAAGVDPDALADGVAGLRFGKDVRSPAGLAMWQMRKTAAGQPGTSDEDSARREAATEWLATEARDTPTDRARATRLVGVFDDSFDAQLADKYPGILSVDDSHIRDHEGRADTATDIAQTSEDAARVEENELAAITPGDTAALAELPLDEPPFDPDYDTPDNVDELDAGTADADRSRGEGQRALAGDERDLAANAESDRSEHAAEARPGDHHPVELDGPSAAEAAAAAPSRTANGTIPARAANPRPRKGTAATAPAKTRDRVRSR